MASAMAEDFRSLLKLIESKEQQPEYNLDAITQLLSSFDDPRKTIHKVLADRSKREADEQKRQQKNRQLEQQLAQRHTEREQAAAEEAAAAAAAAEAAAEEPQVASPVAGQHEEDEPEATEPLCLVPHQPLPPLDLSPLELPITGAPALALLKELIVNREIWFYTTTPHDDPESAASVLQLLFHVVSYGEQSYEAYRCMVQHYEEVEPEAAVGSHWVPRLSDFYAVLCALGYQATRGAVGGGGGRKRNRGSGGGGDKGESGGGAAGGPSGSGGGGDDAVGGPGAANGSTGGEGGGGLAGVRMANLRYVLKLLGDVGRLHGEGRLELGWGGPDEAHCKDLFTALLRMLLDPDLSAVLYEPVQSALEALMQPWDDTLWARLCRATASTAAGLGPSPGRSHRAALRVIGCVQGGSERVRLWQQMAAMELLRKTVPQHGHDKASGSGGGSRRGGGGSEGGIELLHAEMKALLGNAEGLRAALCRGGGGGGTRGGNVDYWRLLTILQCVHLIMAGEEDDSAVAWLAAYLRSLEQRLDRKPAAMRVLALLADLVFQYGTARE